MPNTIKTALGFDFGLARIGVAYGQSLTQTASPVGIVRAKEGIPNWDEVGALLKKFQADDIIVGLPANMDGTDNPITIAARKFAKRIEGKFGVTVQMVDERLSSKAVHYEMDKMGQEKKKKGRIDNFAACLILETFFQGQA